MSFPSTFNTNDLVASNLVEAKAEEEYRAQNHERAARYFPYESPAAVSSNHTINGNRCGTVSDEVSLDLPVAPKTPVIGPSNASQDDVDNLILDYIETPLAPPTPGPEVIAQINQEHEVDPQDLAYALEDVQAFNRHVHNIAAFILREFVAGLIRARHD